MQDADRGVEAEDAGSQGRGRRRLLRDVALGAAAFTIARETDAQAATYGDTLPFTITPPSGNSSNLTDWTDPSGTPLLSVEDGGRLHGRRNLSSSPTSVSSNAQ